MRRLAVLLAATLALVTAACGKHEPTGTAVLGLVSDSVEVNPSESQLLLAKARWTSERNARDYTFVTAFACFCAANVGTAVRVTVHGTQVVSVHEVTSGRSRLATEYYSIEALFDRAVDARARDESVRVKYAAGGYPAQLTIGTPENDGGVTYGVSEVRLQ
jgi:hypothetical protein